LGFITRVNIRETDQFASYYWRPAGGALLAFGPSLSAAAVWNHQGLRQDWSAQPQFDVFFRNQYGISFWHTESSEYLSGVDLRHRRDTISAYSAQSKQFSVNGTFTGGTSPNYSPPSGIAPFLADAVMASLGGTFRPNQRLRIDQTYYYTHLSSPAGIVASGP